LEIGVMKYMVEILMKELPTAQHGTLDGLVKKLNKAPNQHGYTTGFPRCTWPDGVTSLAKLTGDQRVGKMFAILLVALTEEGETFFTKYLPGGGNTWTRMVYCFEQILCYWAWLKQDHLTTSFTVKTGINVELTDIQYPPKYPTRDIKLFTSARSPTKFVRARWYISTQNRT
jgi:hypothetical protein